VERPAIVERATGPLGLRRMFVRGAYGARRRRHRAGCLEFATTADLIDPGRVNLFGDWESQTAVNAFRRRAPRNKQGAAMRSASVAESDIADVRPLSRKGRA